MASSWIEYNGKQIFYVDMHGFKSNEVALEEEMDRTIGKQGRGMDNMPIDSVLLLVDLRDTTISRRVQNRITERINETRKYVKKTAIVGLSGIRRVFFDYFTRLVRAETMGFDNPEEAKKWLAA